MSCCYVTEVTQASPQEGTLLSAASNTALTQLTGKRKFISHNKKCRGRHLHDLFIQWLNNVTKDTGCLHYHLGHYWPALWAVFFVKVE